MLVEFGDDEDIFQQVVDTVTVERADRNRDGFAAPFFRRQVFSGQILHDAVYVGVGAVDLVDGDDNGHAGRLGVADRLPGLGHDAIVGGYDEDDDVGDLRAAGPHRGECLVAGRIQEGNLLAVDYHLVGAGMLGDAAGFGIDDVGAADLVEERRFAVIHVAEDRHNRRPGHEVFFRLFGHDFLDHHPFYWSSILVGRLLRLFVLHDRPQHLNAEFFAHDGGCIVVESLIDRRHNAELHQHFNEIDWTAIHSFG